MQFAISKRGHHRLQQLRAEIGSELGADHLATADQIRALFPDFAGLITDGMVALWAQSGFLKEGLPALIEPGDLYHLLAWYYIVYPTETDGGLFSDLAEPGVHRMARWPVRDSIVPGLPYSALMLALYHYRPDVRANVNMPGDGMQGDLLHWYYVNGVAEFKLARCVTAGEIAALNEALVVHGIALLSVLDLWALERGGAMGRFDLTKPAGQIQAREAAWKLRAEDPILLLYEPASGPRKRPQDTHDLMPSAELPLFLTRPMAQTDTSEYRVTVGHAEHFGRKLRGNRLLVPEEWFDPDSNYVWAKCPIASLLFSPQADAPGGLDSPPRPPGMIGLLIHPYAGAATLGQTIQVLLNGVLLDRIDVGRAIGREIVLRKGVAANLRPGRLNLLQVITDRPLIPSVHLNSHDTRRLGVALRRFWVG